MLLPIEISSDSSDSSDESVNSESSEENKERCMCNPSAVVMCAPGCDACNTTSGITIGPQAADCYAAVGITIKRNESYPRGQRNQREQIRRRKREVLRIDECNSIASVRVDFLRCYEPGFRWLDEERLEPSQQYKTHLFLKSDKQWPKKSCTASALKSHTISLTSDMSDSSVRSEFS